MSGSMGESEEMIQVRESFDSVSDALPLVQQDLEKLDLPTHKRTPHVVFFVAAWLAFSSATVLFNKYILSTAGFHYPILLTSWHMAFASIATQILARTTHMLDSRTSITIREYARTIIPIGVLFSLCLICGNLAYVYLTVSFVQMLKASMPVVTVCISWSMGMTPLSLSTLGKVSVIVLGVVIASYGELQFVVLGVVIQLGSVVFDAVRLVLMNHLLTTKMDAVVLLYYLSPLCFLINGTIACFTEIPKISFVEIQALGFTILLGNAAVAFALNIATVLLISKTTSLGMTLCGVFKNIVIVLASIIIFGDPISLLQSFGYSLALASLLYHQLSGDKTNWEKITELYERALYAREDLKQTSPVIYYVTAVTAAILVAVGILGAVSWTGILPPDYDIAKITLAKGLETIAKVHG